MYIRVAPNVVKVMFIAYLSLSVTVMVISFCGNVLVIYMVIFKSCL